MPVSKEHPLKTTEADIEINMEAFNNLKEGKRRYKRCYGPAFIMQFSGSGLVAPCGMLFNRRFKI